MGVSAMAQQIIVGVIVAVAALYVLWRYLPARWRERLGLAPAPGCGAGSGGGCSSCGGCSAAGRAGEEKPVVLPDSRH